MTMCALGTILFLGGWLSPIPFAPFTWIPGIFWFVLKASFLFLLIAMVKALVGPAEQVVARPPRGQHERDDPGDPAQADERVSLQRDHGLGHRQPHHVTSTAEGEHRQGVAVVIGVELRHGVEQERGQQLVEGEVVLEIVVRRDGSVGDVTLLQADAQWAAKRYVQASELLEVAQEPLHLRRQRAAYRRGLLRAAAFATDRGFTGERLPDPAEIPCVLRALGGTHE